MLVRASSTQIADTLILIQWAGLVGHLFGAGLAWTYRHSWHRRHAGHLGETHTLHSHHGCHGVIRVEWWEPRHHRESARLTLLELLPGALHMTTSAHAHPVTTSTATAATRSFHSTILHIPTIALWLALESLVE
jgi:hypothetical protein